MISCGSSSRSDRVNIASSIDSEVKPRRPDRIGHAIAGATPSAIMAQVVGVDHLPVVPADQQLRAAL
jgi:hypothetical protein